MDAVVGGDGVIWLTLEVVEAEKGGWFGGFDVAGVVAHFLGGVGVFFVCAARELEGGVGDVGGGGWVNPLRRPRSRR